MKKFLKNPWVYYSILILLGLAAAYFIIKKIGGAAWDKLNQFIGNPTTDQSITGNQQYHTNILDASLQSITGGPNDQTNVTRTSEFTGLFQAAEGDRAWSDLTSHPLGFLGFMVTGDKSLITGANN